MKLHSIEGIGPEKYVFGSPELTKMKFQFAFCGLLAKKVSRGRVDKMSNESGNFSYDKHMIT